MTRDQINALLRRVQLWPLVWQEEAARALLAIEVRGQMANPQLSPAPSDDPELRSLLEEAGQDDVASDSEVEAVFVRPRS